MKTPKLHLVDSGLACWLLGIRTPQQLHSHPLRGSIVESWVVSEVRKAWLNRGERPRMWFYRERSGREVDLVVDRGDALLAVEVKSGRTVPSDAFRELNRFAAIVREASAEDTTTVVPILVYGGDERRRQQGVEVLPWHEIQSWSWTPR
ncbi:MAG: DUF4143 domain-containing protein [Deltaproteobacteria bacterium]|nr:DUF4143 domain-containing protein [Deltaproteobacteria bacterium]MBW2254323.1 DUF4143 domain-containing protein [Deltaproteobacteria bacterium]